MYFLVLLLGNLGQNLKKGWSGHIIRKIFFLNFHFYYFLVGVQNHLKVITKKWGSASQLNHYENQQKLLLIY